MKMASALDDSWHMPFVRGCGTRIPEVNACKRKTFKCVGNWEAKNDLSITGND